MSIASPGPISFDRSMSIRDRTTSWGLTAHVADVGVFIISLARICFLHTTYTDAQGGQNMDSIHKSSRRHTEEASQKYQPLAHTKAIHAAVPVSSTPPYFRKSTKVIVSNTSHSVHQFHAATKQVKSAHSYTALLCKSRAACSRTTASMAVHIPNARPCSPVTVVLV